MSLESELKKLNANLEAINATLAGNVQPAQAKTEVKAEPVVDEVKEAPAEQAAPAEETTKSAGELRKCLLGKLTAISKIDANSRKKAMELVNDFGARTISDIPDNLLHEALAKADELASLVATAA